MIEKQVVQPEGDNRSACCCGPAAKDNLRYRPVAVTGTLSTANGNVDIVSTGWSFSDYLGCVGVRWGINRMNYAVQPGLYAVGKPGKSSPVLVSANYKLSFDVLRRELNGLDAWILVIDTKGVNVWCAAGKGTFGTMEVARRVMMTGLEQVVDTRTLILPQLGAPGVAAHMVKSFCGFNVVYGPVRANDLKAFLASGMKADKRMRRVTFTLKDRLAVSWMELSMALSVIVLVTVALLSIGAAAAGGFSFAAAWERSRLALYAFWTAVVSGTVLSAALLPYLPGRAFSLKGGVLGLTAAAVLLAADRPSLPAASMVSLALLMVAVSAYLALNFTGASTYTSHSGVRKEMRVAVPVLLGMVAAAALAQILQMAGIL